MQVIIDGEHVFRVYENIFAVSPSETGYTLSYSADGINFSNVDTQTPAGETLVVSGVAKEMVFKLIGNGSRVTITF